MRRVHNVVNDSSERVHCRYLVWPALGIALALLCAGPLFASEPEQGTTKSGPVYVQLDSWVYPALKKLAAMGYVPDEEGLAAPWTRSECLMLVKEAEDIASRHSTKVSNAGVNEDAQKMIATLEREFADENDGRPQARIESIYTQLLQISGPPLQNSYHFGQTIVDDYGRPYETGTNAVAGFSAFGTIGRFSGYFRGEYQEAGGGPPYSQSVQNYLGAVDGVPVQPAARVASTSRFDPLEMYVGAHFGDFDFTFGKQSLWWGPGQDSAFAFSNNAEPFYSLRIAQQTPFVLPGPFRFLGHIRTQMLVGKLSGHLYPPRPFINAEKVTFQLTENLEVGFTRSAIFGGVGHPLTTASILRSFFSTSSTGSTAFGAANDPGDRRSGFDFLWRVPGVRRFVTIYSDSLADDEPNPLDSPRRSAWAPGIYFTKLPGLRRMDLRFETYSTWLYRGDEGGAFFYWNNQYRDAYTNNGFLLGSWVGRDARAYEASSTYWWSAQNKLVLSFRQTKTGSNFVPGGGTQSDVSVSGQWQLRPDLAASPFVQFERYFIPILGGPKQDVSFGLQITFAPKNMALSR
ncbi:MAG TPA: capsule assembly Wzi family protein [Bryobacteraceae bacterium]|nr:capsule assembly Wzi family protein [Bryobacteraceae bacterium]